MVKQSNHQKLTVAVEALGATIDQTTLHSEATTYNLDAPLGKVWAATGAHTLCQPFARESSPYPSQAEAARRLMADVLDGLTDCDTPDCETCGDRRGE